MCCGAGGPTAADRLRSSLDAAVYKHAVLGLIFLKFADNRYKRFESQILAEYEQLKSTRRDKPLHEIALAKCGFFLRR